jgi:hypothetical protein
VASKKIEEQLRLARERAEQEFRQAETERKRQLFEKRLAYAQEGANAYGAGDYTAAVRAMSLYIAVLEHAKQVKPNGLTPKHFEGKDRSELPMVSAVYWDLVKIYDRTKAKDKRKKFFEYMDKYLLFSKGMPYQPLCAEALRKYAERANHTADFKKAYRQLTGEKCFVATSLHDVLDPGTLPRLRSLRDERLARHASGRAFIRIYYFVGPGLADLMDRMPRPVRRACARALDLLARQGL